MKFAMSNEALRRALADSADEECEAGTLHPEAPTMSEAPKAVWVTKYALTAGVKQYPLVRLEEDGDVWAKLPGTPSYGALIGPKDHHPTREAALARANEMKAAKIASLKRQIERLESLEF